MIPDGTGNLLSKLGTKRNRDDGTTPRQQTLAVSREQVGEFLGLLREANFWSLPTAQYEESLTRLADAKEWLLEANKSGKYHVVDRSDGLIEVSVSRACDYLLELSPLKAETGHRTRSTIQPSTPTPD